VMEAGVALSSDEEAMLRDCFGHWIPTPDQGEGIFEVMAAAREFFKVVLINAPASADRSAALRSIREANMWARSAIALGGRR